MEFHTDGPYAGFSSDGQRLFDELDRLLKQPNGLQHVFEEFGRRQVCDAIMSEEPPLSSQTVAEMQESLEGFLNNHPDMRQRKFEFSMTLLPKNETSSN